MYEAGYYQNLSAAEIADKVQAEGFDPLRISDLPGTVYAPHSHPETKLLAFLRGTMRVTIQGKTYDCSPGDRLIVPGTLEHSAQVGSEGCVFFWSEKMV